MTKAKITIENKLYGDRVYDGYKTREESPFVVFKGRSKLWTIGHAPSRMLVESLIPSDMPRKRASLLNFVENIELAKPDEVAIAATVTGEGFTPAQSEALQAIRRFALS